MKRFSVCVLVAIGFALVFYVPAIAAGVKIGYLDVTRAAASSKWGKKIDSALKKEEQKLATAVKQKNQAYVTARDDYLKKKDVMGAKARDQKERQLRSMLEDLQKLASDSQMKWDKQKNAAMTPLFKRIFEIANKIAKKEKYDLIIDSRALVVPPGEKYDITSRVVSELDKEAPK